MAARPRLSAEFRRLGEACAAERLTFGRLAAGLGPRDHALLTAFVAACFMHPVPMPGLSSALGAVIVVAGWRMALGQGPWIPERLAARAVPAKALRRVFGAAEAASRRLERLVRPRARFLTSHPWALRLNGALIAATGLLILIPLPPPTNFPPAIALLLLSVGVLEEDGLALAAGYLAFALNLLLFGAIAAFGYAGIRTLAS